MALYHKDVFMPEAVKNMQVTDFHIDVISFHAQDRATEIGIKLSRDIIAGGEDIIEADYSNGRLNKIVVRFPVSEESNFDVCYVLESDMRKGIVLKTVWTNHRDDNHRTLNKWMYATE